MISFRGLILGRSTVGPNEILSRFINKPGNCRKDGTPKPRVFEPRVQSRAGVFGWRLSDKKSGEACLSTSRTSGLTSGNIWKIGKKVLRRAHPSKVYARADLQASVFVEHGLTVRGDRSPRYHASILNWPEEAEQKLIAKELAAVAPPVILNPRP